MLQKLGPILALGLFLAIPSHAAILEVNCNPAPWQYPDINAAVAASSPGDTIAVEPCSRPYPGFSIVSTSQLHVIAVDPLGAAPEGVDAIMHPPVFIEEPNGPCVSIDGSSGITIYGFSILSCYGEGILAKNSESVVIEGNRIKGVQASGIGVSGSNMTITGNHILASVGAGIYLDDTSLSRVTNNHVELSDSHGIWLYGGWYNEVLNNYLLDNNDVGILLLMGEEHRVERNTVLNSATDDMYCDYVNDPDFVANDISGSFTDNCNSDVY